MHHFSTKSFFLDHAQASKSMNLIHKRSVVSWSQRFDRHADLFSEHENLVGLRLINGFRAVMIVPFPQYRRRYIDEKYSLLDASGRFGSHFVIFCTRCPKWVSFQERKKRVPHIDEKGSTVKWRQWFFRPYRILRKFQSRIRFASTFFIFSFFIARKLLLLDKIQW